MKYKVKKFGELEVGDKLVSSTGEVTTVTNVYDKHIPDRMYEIVMDDGSIVKASGNHLWYCESDIDLKEKESYMELAKEYFSKHEIPQKREDNPHYPMHILVSQFDDDVNTMLFIERAAKSLGYSSSTPHIVLDGYIDRHDEVLSETLVYRYSYNDLIDFLHDMKNAINGEGYFYFGKVRTTDEIYELKRYNINVNIPTKGEIK